MNHSRLYAALSLALASSVVWAGASLSYERLIKEFPDSIRSVVSCGRWSEGTEVGTFRVLEARIFDASFLYVQWMMNDITNAGSVVVHTVEVAPFNDDHSGFDIESISCNDKGPDATVSVLSRDESDTLRTTTIQLPHRGKELHVSEVPSNNALEQTRDG